MLPARAAAAGDAVKSITVKYSNPSGPADTQTWSGDDCDDVHLNEFGFVYPAPYSKNTFILIPWSRVWQVTETKE